MSEILNTNLGQAALPALELPCNSLKFTLRAMDHDNLRLILAYAGVEGIAQLWCSGDRLLSSKLLTSVEIAVHHPMTLLPSRWPRVLRYLPNLRVFRFYAPGMFNQCNGSLNREHLQSLSPFLEELTFISPIWPRYWHNSILIESHASTVEELTIDLSKCYPNLKKLTVKAGEAPSPTLETTTNFFPLPPGLTHLDLANHNHSWKLDDFDLLPPSLQVFAAGVKVNGRGMSNSDFLKNLPNLTSLDFKSLDCLNAVSLQAMSHHLTSLKIASATMEGCKDSFSQFPHLTDLHLNVSASSLDMDIIPFLPPRLTRLALAGTSDALLDWAKDLPETLTSLSILSNGSTISFFRSNDKDLSLFPESLPSSLLSLSLPREALRSSNPEIPIFSTFPRSLTSLSIVGELNLRFAANSAHVGDDSLIFLPANLTSLRFDLFWDWTPEMLSLLPIPLLRLSISGGFNFNLSDADIPPPGLQFDSMAAFGHSSHPSPTWKPHETMDGSTLRRLERMAKAFPPRIRYLTIGASLPMLGSSDRPSGLTIVDLLITVGHLLPEALEDVMVGPERYWRLGEMVETRLVENDIQIDSQVLSKVEKDSKRSVASSKRRLFVSIHSAVEKDDVEMLEKIVPFVGWGEIRTMGLTHSAALKDACRVLKWLVANGCDPKRENAARAAANNGSFSVLNYLVDSLHIDLFTPNIPSSSKEQHCTAGWAMLGNKPIAFLDWLQLKHLSSPSSFPFPSWDSPNQTPLKRAVELGHIEALDWYCLHKPETPHVAKIRELLLRFPKLPSLGGIHSVAPPPSSSTLPTASPSNDSQNTLLTLWEDLLELGSPAAIHVLSYLHNNYWRRAPNSDSDQNGNTFAHYLASSSRHVPKPLLIHIASNSDWLSRPNKQLMLPLQIAQQALPHNEQLVNDLIEIQTLLCLPAQQPHY